ncbi:hypothetical protein [Marinovum sp.]|uniref:hypothetical protein n=1 Tax=Marinovum sp. TaxID=2024839 RepID=UPI003A929630
MPPDPVAPLRRGAGTVILCLALVLSGIVAGASAALAQAATVPENAHARSYGDGWECDRGFRPEGDGCESITVPENAYPTNRTYGLGWACQHGYLRVDETACVEVAVPAGGYLDPSGESWSCLRGYKKTGDLCEEVILPANAYLSDETRGSVWTCERGYEGKGDGCVVITVPENAYPNGASYGQTWSCNRGYRERDGACEAVVVPENAYFHDVSYGPSWRCNRGFEAVDKGCVAIVLPANAHLDRTGNRWECNRNHQLSRGRCLLNE